MSLTAKNTLKKVFVEAMVLAAMGTGVCFSASLAYQNQMLRTEVQTLSTEVDARDQEIREKDEELDALKQQAEAARREAEAYKEEVSRRAARAMRMTVTEYDLSVASCGKEIGHPAYGLTSSGMSLAGHTLESARAIAVDPSVIPLGSKVRIKFDDASVQHLDGIYTAVDTGGAIQGSRIDLFFGDFQSYHPAPEALQFGRREAEVILL